MIFIAASAFDLALITQRCSHPLAYMAGMATFAGLLISPFIFLLLAIARND